MNRKIFQFWQNFSDFPFFFLCFLTIIEQAAEHDIMRRSKTSLFIEWATDLLSILQNE
jgi:hypothetical protein